MMILQIGVSIVPFITPAIQNRRADLFLREIRREGTPPDQEALTFLTGTRGFGFSPNVQPIFQRLRTTTIEHLDRLQTLQTLHPTDRGIQNNIDLWSRRLNLINAVSR